MVREKQKLEQAKSKAIPKKKVVVDSPPSVKKTTPDKRMQDSVVLALNR